MDLQKKNIGHVYTYSVCVCLHLQCVCVYTYSVCVYTYSDLDFNI
jgi:hypothetical protein